jgi:hypothetical protein
MSSPTRLFACSFSATKENPDRTMLLKQGLSFVPAATEDAAREAGENLARESFRPSEGYANHFAFAVAVPAGVAQASIPA